MFRSVIRRGYPYDSSVCARRSWWLAMIWVAVPLAARADAGRYFRILVVDQATGRGVPLVELRTVNQIRLYTDSAGMIAFEEPGLMDRDVYFHVRSHGYEYPVDGFGNRGVRLKTEPGGRAVIKIKRNNIAERLYRITGQGIYRDSVLLGDQPSIKTPNLNGKVLGSDSVVNVIHRGKLLWFWGDTNRPGYPLGNFHVPGATSRLPAEGGLHPDQGVELQYFVDERGFAKPTCKMPGVGPTWINGLVSVPDRDGHTRLFATYVKIKGMLQVYRRGIAEFNEATTEFEHRLDLPLSESRYPFGHPFRHVDDGTEYVYFADPIPTLRVRATAESLLDPTQYQAWTPLIGRERQPPLVDRSDSGRPVFRWRNRMSPFNRKWEQELIKSGEMHENDRLFTMTDRETGDRVRVHRGSVYWNAFRDAWVMVFTETEGRSMLGEVWYSEADELTGPWQPAIRIVTHDEYSFYNPKQHPMLQQEDGRFIYFEGTYTHTFSGNPDRTPRYDYNQIMYRLDLADPRLTYSNAEDR